MTSYSPNEIKLSDKLEINSIVWIHSLPDEDMGPTRRIIEDIKSINNADGFTVSIHAVGSRAEFFVVMADLADDAAQLGLRPIIHIDAHGNLNEGIKLSSSGETLEWSEAVSCLRKLNEATGNNLICILALCYGLQMYKEVELKYSVPAYLLCGPASEVTVGFLEDKTIEFYREVLEGLNVTNAFESTLGLEMKSFHCQGVLFNAIVQYIENYASGKALRKRQEDILTKALVAKGIDTPNSNDLQKIRKPLKKKLKPSQYLIDHFAPKFLVGREAAFTYADIRKALDVRKKNK